VSINSKQNIRKLEVYSLSYTCPKSKDRDKDCPFLEMDHLSFKEKIAWIDQLDDKKKDTFLKHHLKCTKSMK